MDELLGEALVTLLRANAAIAAMVADRIFPQRLPQKFRTPAIRYGEGATTEYLEELAGATEHATATLPLTCIGPSDAKAKEFARLVRRALRGHRGTTAGLRIKSIRIPAQTSTFVEREDGGDGGWYEERLDLVVDYVTTS